MVPNKLKIGETFEIEMAQMEAARQVYKAAPPETAVAMAQETLQTAPPESVTAKEARRYIHEREVGEALRRLLPAEVQVTPTAIPGQWIDYELVNGATRVAVLCLTEERMGLGEWWRFPGYYRRTIKPIADGEYTGGLFIYQAEERLHESKTVAGKTFQYVSWHDSDQDFDLSRALLGLGLPSRQP
jgi:hypothetical protein